MCATDATSPKASLAHQAHQATPGLSVKPAAQVASVSSAVKVLPGETEHAVQRVREAPPASQVSKDSTAEMVYLVLLVALALTVFGDVKDATVPRV